MHHGTGKKKKKKKFYMICRWGELDSSGSGQGLMAGLCEHGNEPSGSIRKQDIFLTS
jgi:hypothetical protein